MRPAIRIAARTWAVVVATALGASAVLSARAGWMHRRHGYLSDEYLAARAHASDALGLAGGMICAAAICGFIALAWYLTSDDDP